jgi:bifunctional non-homologous end joining protein LigD
MKKAIRTNKVFVDWSQNDEHKTTVSVYALRARERPTVSTPVTWDEVVHALKKKDPSLLVFESQQVIERVDEMGDLFAPLLSLKQKLPKLPGIGEGNAEAVATGLQMAAQAESNGRKSPSTAKKKAQTGRRPSSAKLRKKI